MAQRNLLATLRSDTARDVDRYSEREVTALLYGDTSYNGSVLEAAVTRTPDGTAYGHISARGGDSGQRRRLMTSVPLAELGAAQILVPLTEQDVADLIGAIAIALDAQPEKRNRLQAKLQGRR